ncbi:MAG TPA: sensor domain-containing diguanylate cyclase [Polyangiales bacterium]|nr:sensor domain-containing diguanylate cyclase [Polyangiales bacterium]
MYSWRIAGVILCILFAVVALTVYQSERSNLQNQRDQFQLRADIAEAFLQTYVQELLARERRVAEQQLSESPISETKFEAVTRAFGFKGAVVLDASGKLLHVYPSSPDLRGTEIGSGYSHLRAAAVDGIAVSNVVSSAAQSAPVVAFATRYDSPSGPRVFSGAFDVRATPVSAYMANFLELEGALADLMDSSGMIVASSRTLTPFVTSLESVDPMLSKALRARRATDYDTGRGRKLFFQRDVTGTPWRLVISVDETMLFASVGGPRRWLPWALFVGFCVTSLVAVYLLLRLRAVSQQHAHLARVDRLTDLPNRLHLEEHMARLVSGAVRQGRPFSVFMADVDHFKRVNDTYGHKIGDEVLRELSVRMIKALRAEDMLGRWGGEEFLALLPNTTEEGAYAVANRVRTMASSSPIETTTGERLQVTISIGCATIAGVRDESVVQRADEALYRAKELGRDRVVSSAPPGPRKDAGPETLAHGA